MNQKILTAVLAALVISQAAFADDSSPASSTTVLTTTVSTTSSVAATDSQFHDETSYLRHIEPKYLSTAGSQDNLASIANGLRTGGMITLQSGTATTGGSGGTSISFDAPTKPMGYGNITHTLDYATRELAAAGITSPTPDQLKAALMGGTVVNVSGQTTTLQGVLQLRSQGMGWGQIAHSLGIPPSPYSKSGTAGKSGLASTSVSGTIAADKQHGGITKAGSVNHGHQGSLAKSPGTGIVSADGNASLSHGSAHSGIVTADGTSMGFSSANAHSQHGTITLASGNSASGSITSASASGHGNAFGKGKN